MSPPPHPTSPSLQPGPGLAGLPTPPHPAQPGPAPKAAPPRAVLPPPLPSPPSPRGAALGSPPPRPGAGRPSPFSRGRPHPRVHHKRGRGLPRAAASRPPPPRAAAGASPALRGSRARHSHKMSALTERLPAATLRPSPPPLSSPLPPPPPRARPTAYSPPRIRPPTPPSRARGEPGGWLGGSGLLPWSRPSGRATLSLRRPPVGTAPPQLHRAEVGPGGRGTEAGHGLKGCGRGGGRGGGQTSGGNAETQRSIENRKETLGGR